VTDSFDSLGLAPSLLEVVAELGYTVPTDVQVKTIPLILAGKDVIARSKTGSGKTAAFALPILDRISLEGRTLTALVLCPTRELCDQVAREIRKLGRRHAGLQVLVLAGGQPIGPQVSSLGRGAHIAVGTPGRIIDLLSRNVLPLGTVTTVVLDEADRMLEMGFKQDMITILRAVPRSRQTVLFSATYPEAIEGMSKAYQRDPVLVTVEDANDDADIVQVAYDIGSENKATALATLLGNHPHELALVFCNLKATVDELARTLSAAGYSVERLHGDLEQNDRDRVIAKFRNRSVRVLIATDVAARGIDVLDLDLVVNFDLPSQPEVYVHRIGRTGRAGRSGLALSLFLNHERRKLASIAEATGKAIEQRTVGPSKAKSSAAPERAAAMVTLYISGGRKAKVRPGDVLGALTGEAGGFDASDIGKIEIRDHFTYVAVTKAIAARAVETLSAGKIKGRRFKVGFVE